jgi:type II secretion system protein I
MAGCIRVTWAKRSCSFCLPMSNKETGCRGGFTLIEVLVATVIFAVSAAVLLQAMSVSLSIFDRSNKVLAKAALETTVVEAILLEGRDAGETNGVQWTSREEPLEWDWDTADRMRKISVSVEGPKIHATLVLYRPLQRWARSGPKSLAPFSKGPGVGR